jgi:hypothetical protein
MNKLLPEGTGGRGVIRGRGEQGEALGSPELLSRMVEVYWIGGKYGCWKILLLFCWLFALSTPYNSGITTQQ